MVRHTARKWENYFWLSSAIPHSSHRRLGWHGPPSKE